MENFVEMVDFILHSYYKKWKQKPTKEHKVTLRVMDVSSTLIVVMVTWMFAYVQTHQIVHIKYVKFFVYQLYLNKVVKKQWPQ